MSTSILVSGGAGYLGSHVCYALQQAGMVPVVLDNLSTGHVWAASFGPFEQGDIADEAFVRAVCDKHAPQAVLHLAGYGSVGDSVKNPAPYGENNRDRPARFFKTLNSCGVKKIVFSGTVAVYGDSGGKILSESHAPRSVHPYGQSKLEAETYLRMLSADGMQPVFLRCANAAGAAPIEARIGEAHMPETHIIPRMILPLLDTPPDILQALGLQNGCTSYGDDYPTPDGTAIRDYVHVLDLAEAHLRALDYVLKNGDSDIFNLGSGQGTSVMELAALVRKTLNRPDFFPGFAPRREGDVVISIADSSKAWNKFAWRSKRSLQDMIQSASLWHASALYRGAVRAKFGMP